jgi:hypothetical protein
MPDIEMNPLLFKAFSHPTTSHEDISEPVYQVSVAYDASTQRAKIQTS